MDKVVIILTAVMLTCVSIMIGGLIVSWLWGWIIPAIFPGLVASGAIVGKISAGTGVGLQLLCSVLFKNLHTKTTKQQ